MNIIVLYELYLVWRTNYRLYDFGISFTYPVKPPYDDSGGKTANEAYYARKHLKSTPKN